jgi:hypothetical protein
LRRQSAAPCCTDAAVRQAQLDQHDSTSTTQSGNGSR